MRGYLSLLKSETRRRFDAGMSPGAAAADIQMGKYDNWIGPERIVMDVQRFYAEFSGTLTPDLDLEGIRKATEEYNTRRKAWSASVGAALLYIQHYDSTSVLGQSATSTGGLLSGKEPARLPEP